MMQMLLTIYKIRFLQLYRLLKDIGIFRFAVLILILGFISIMGFNLLKQPENTNKAIIISALILLFIHAARKDKRFLKVTFKNVYLIYWLEYFFLILPVLIIWIIFKNLTGAGELLLIGSLIPLIYLNIGLQNTSSILKILINPFSSNLNFNFNIRLPFINCYAFEWTSGIRRNLFILAPAYLLFLSFSFRPYVAPIGIILISLIVSG